MQNDIWQVEVKGKIYEGELAELEQWILEHALLPEDNVRRAGRAWIPAGQVPALQKVFAGLANHQTSSETTESSTNIAPATLFQETSAEPTRLVQHNVQPKVLSAHGRSHQEIAFVPEACHFHENEAAIFVCRQCSNGFCKACPKNYGTVRICPVCGEMCKPVSEVQARLKKTAQRSSALGRGYGFEDFAQAWTYPFKFWQSLCLGAVFVAVLSLGGFFGNLLSTAIVFGCIAQAISLVAQGNYEDSFMPNFDDFNIWEDVVRPVLLSFTASIVPFLPLFLVVIFSLGFLSSPTYALILNIGLTLLWALFYLPMALAIAGYTHSFAATINPLVAIDTMRRMGWVYLAAFFFCFIVYLSNFALAVVIGYVTAPFDLPLVGNLPGKFLVSIVSFYFSLVIAFILGAALFKTSDRLGIEIN